MVDTAKLIHIADCVLDGQDEVIVRDAVDEIVRLRAALRNVRGYIKDCDHDPALDEIDAALTPALKPMPKGPAGDRGQVGWMGGEFDR